MISRFFISRPVFSTVLSLIILLSGLMAMRALPVAQYPDIVPPEIVVVASYPGANAETIGETVAAPLEQEINGVDNMIYMRSTSSSSGMLFLIVSFAIGTDPDQAAIDVNNRVKAAEPFLPEDVRRQGVRVSKRSSNFLMVTTLESSVQQYDAIFISNYALLNVIDELKRVPGVGEAALFGAKDYSMRIWLRPDKLAQYKLSPSDVAAAIREQNAQFAAGQFGQEPMEDPQTFTYSVSTEGRMAKPSEFENIILRADPQGGSLRLKDVARVELGAQTYAFTAIKNGAPAVPIQISLQPGANALATAAAVREKMEELSARFPEGISYDVPYDTTEFVSISIEEVVHTFVEAILLVVLVVFLFLQNVRATLIPLLAIPVSIVGTFAGMYVLGFSINLLTLFGLILAIGIVVDDAIIVIENAERIMREEKLGPKAAAFKAMEEVAGPVVAIVLVLSAVFIPVAFLGGLTGQMYTQFAVTIAVSVIISGVVALTLTPALCAVLLKPAHEEPGGFFRGFNTAFARFSERYLKGVRFLVDRSVVGLGLFGAMIALTALLFKLVPGGLVPPEDQGFVLTVFQLPPAASLDRTEAVSAELTERLMNDPAVETVVTFSGFDILSGSLRTNAGAAFVTLTDWSERTSRAEDARNLVGRFAGFGQSIHEAMVFSFNPPPIQGMSTAGGFEVYVQSRAGATSQELAQSARRLAEAAKQRPELQAVRTTFGVDTPQFSISLDREKARALDIPINEVFATMQSTFGSLYVNDFTLYGRNYRVFLQSEAEFRRTPDDLRHVFVRSRGGTLVPLDVLVSVDRTIGPDVVERFNGFPAAKMMGEPAPGYSSGQAIAAMKALAAETLTNDYTLGWIGSAYQEEVSSGSGTAAFAFGILMVFLILAAQYERWSMPLAVLTAIPFAAFGAVLATWLRGLENDIYFQIGLVTLIGLAAKNAILIVEFAMIHRRSAGVSNLEAAMEAARLRFRPIVMTSLAFTLGALPLAVSSGAGSASRHAIGTGVVGGMLAVTLIGTFFIPMFYRLIAGLADRGRKKTAAAEPAAGSEQAR